MELNNWYLTPINPASAEQASMPKVPHAREHHSHVSFIRRVNHFLIAHRSTGLNHACRALVHHHIQAIAEWEKRIAGHHGVLQ
jgi:hypothetical protein